MNFKNNFKELYQRFIRRTVLKSLVYSLLISFFCLFFISLFFWFYGVKQFWIAIIAFVAIEAILFGLFYKINYPNDKVISRELDSHGLEQRIITMHDYQESESLMARIQRQNATEKLNKFDAKVIKLVLPTVAVVFLIIGIVLGSGLLTVSALAADGKIDSGHELIEEVIPEIINQYELVYDVDGEGEIIGEMFQVVQEGESGTEVEAQAMDGWAFVGWSDGNEELIRCDVDVHENLTILATFQELDEEEQDGDGDGDGEEGEPSDEEREGEPQDEQSENEQEGDGEPQDGEGGGEGGKYEANNQVIDGNTYYGDSTYDAAYSDAMNDVSQDNSMSDGEKSIISDYYSTIEK